MGLSWSNDDLRRGSQSSRMTTINYGKHRGDPARQGLANVISRLAVGRHACCRRWLWRDWSRRNLGTLSLTLTAAPLDYPPSLCQLLNEYSAHEIHLYEADDRPGGHANTVRVAQSGKEPVDVDTYVMPLP